MAFSGVPLAAPPIEAFQQKLIKYATSEKISGYFCGTCGTQVGYLWTAEDRWMVCPGAIVEIIGPSSGNGKLEKYNYHEYVADTIDGGLSNSIPNIPCYVETRDGPIWPDPGAKPAKKSASIAGTYGEEKLQASCHCGGVQFSILRPQPG